MSITLNIQKTIAIFYVGLRS